MVFPQGSGTLLLRLLAPFQRHSWDASGEAEGDLPPCRSSLGVDSPFLPDASSNAGNSGAAGSPGQAGNFPSAGNVQLGVEEARAILSPDLGKAAVEQAPAW